MKDKFREKIRRFRIREKHVMNSLQDVESQMINSSSLLAPIASSETLESSAAISRPLSAFIEKNDVKPMAIVKPRPQSEVIEEELEKPSLPPKKVINYKEIEIIHRLFPKSLHRSRAGRCLQ